RAYENRYFPYLLIISSIIKISYCKCSTRSGIGLPDATLLPFSRHNAVPLISRCAHGMVGGQKWCSSQAADALIAALLVGVLHRSAMALSVCFFSRASSGRDHTSSPLCFPASVSA